MALELNEIEEKAEEQEGRGDELKEEVENHRERVAKLDEAVKELQGIMSKIESAEGQQALDAMQNAKRETERMLEEKQAEQEQLLEENAEMDAENTAAHDEAQAALEKVEAITQIAGGDEGGIAGPLAEMESSLRADVQHRFEVAKSLFLARQKLEAVM